MFAVVRYLFHLPKNFKLPFARPWPLNFPEAQVWLMIYPIHCHHGLNFGKIMQQIMCMAGCMFTSKHHQRLKSMVLEIYLDCTFSCILAHCSLYTIHCCIFLFSRVKDVLAARSVGASPLIFLTIRKSSSEIYYLLQHQSSRHISVILRKEKYIKTIY